MLATLNELFRNFGGTITSMKLTDIVDIVIVAFLIYKLIGFFRKTNSTGVAKGIILLLLALWLSTLLKLNVIRWLLSEAVQLGLLALIILFQPELRHLLERVGNRRVSAVFRSESQQNDTETAITQIVLACADMSASKTGALIVFERSTRLDDQIKTGTQLDSKPVAELIKNIFFNKAPLHDGALIMRDGRMISAGCVLPLSSNPNLSRELGTRHRAAVGMSELSDAVVVVVSEETGAISVAVNGMLKRHLSVETFDKLLRKELMPENEQDSDRRGRFFKKLRGDRE